MVIVGNLTYSNIYLEVDGFRGATCSISLRNLLSDSDRSGVLYNNGSTGRWGIYEINLNPTQSSPRATIYGFTGPGLDVRYGQWEYTITKNNQLLEKGLMFVSGNNENIY